MSLYLSLGNDPSGWSLTILHLQVIGVPVAIDGDLKNQFVETDVGFDSTCKVYTQSFVLWSSWQKKMETTFFSQEGFLLYANAQ